MKAEELRNLLLSKKPFSLDEVQKVIYELIYDSIGIADLDNKYECGFYAGEMNAFYLCLDLLRSVVVDDTLEKEKKTIRKETAKYVAQEFCYEIEQCGLDYGKVMNVLKKLGEKYGVEVEE